MTAETSDVLVSVTGNVGRLTLNRPAALNALTHPMTLTLLETLTKWAADDSVKMVLIDGAGEKAFCAGGDIVAIYHDGRANPESPRQFWRDEYQLNTFIERYPKPYVSILDGIVMGGGVGVGAHAAHRVVTERSTIAMPETAIGFIPDVGGTRLLGLAPGRLGEYLAATSGRMKAGDAIYAGFADDFVPSAKLEELVAALLETADPEVIKRFAEPPPPSTLAAKQAEIDRLFAADDPTRLMAGLTGSDFAEATAAEIAKHSPFAVACALTLVRQARGEPEIAACLAREFRYGWRTVADPGSDFYEGVRAMVIDKDKSPKWRHAALADVSPIAVAAMLAPLNGEEWGYRG